MILGFSYNWSLVAETYLVSTLSCLRMSDIATDMVKKGCLHVLWESKSIRCLIELLLVTGESQTALCF